MLLNCGVGEDSWESLGVKEIQPVHPRGNQSNWKDWCWSWNSNTLATWCEEVTHLKRPWCWERLKAGREGHDRGWDGWITDSMGMSLSRLREFVMDRAWCSPWGHKESDTTECLNWTELKTVMILSLLFARNLVPQPPLQLSNVRERFPRSFQWGGWIFF